MVQAFSRVFPCKCIVPRVFCRSCTVLRYVRTATIFPSAIGRFINADIWSMVSISSQRLFCSGRTFKVHDGRPASHVRFFLFFLAMIFSAARCAKSPEGNIWRPFSDDRSKPTDDIKYMRCGTGRGYGATERIQRI